MGKMEQGNSNRGTLSAHKFTAIENRFLELCPDYFLHRYDFVKYFFYVYVCVCRAKMKVDSNIETKKNQFKKKTSKRMGFDYVFINCDEGKSKNRGERNNQNWTCNLL